QVSCSYPGADPTTMANNIATPLEKQFLQIPGLDIITSNSTQSNTSFTLQFVLSKSIVDAATDVQAAIQRATGKLPLDLPSPPTFTKTNPNDQAIYLLGLLSDTLTDGDLYKYASTAVAQRIAILPGVSQVNIYGVQDERISRTFWMRGFNPPGSVVVLAVSRQAGANAVEVANSVKALFPEIRASLPGSITLVPVFDRSQSIVDSVHDVQFTLMIAFILVVM